jgi:integrase
VLGSAKVRGWRSGENPARWRGHLDHVLPKRAKLTRGHHAAMPFDEVPGFVAKVREIETLGAMALEFTILTASRTSEVLKAEWKEFELDRAVWTIPAARMKAGREHRVPLSACAVAILRKLAEVRLSDFVVPGMKANQPVSGMVMTMLLRRMQLTDITVHGLRSAFRDWTAECTEFPNEVCEAALAHVINNKAQAA